MKITIQRLCPHCLKHTETIRFESNKRSLHICIECRKEPTGSIVHPLEIILDELQRVLMKINPKP